MLRYLKVTSRRESTNKKARVSAGAHATILLHAFKFPHAAVCGVLVGGVEGDEVVVTHAVPMAHDHINLAPMLEIALMQAEAAFSEAELVGYYQANAHAQDNEIGESGKKIGEKIRLQTKSGLGCMLLVDNSKISNLGKSSALKVYCYDTQRKDWKAYNEESIAIPEGSSSNIAKAFQKGDHQRLADFNDHLQDVSLDWFNKELLSQF